MGSDAAAIASTRRDGTAKESRPAAESGERRDRVAPIRRYRRCTGRSRMIITSGRPCSSSSAACSTRLDGFAAKIFDCRSAFGEVFDAITDGICYGFALVLLGG